MWTSRTSTWLEKIAERSMTGVCVWVCACASAREDPMVPWAVSAILDVSSCTRPGKHPPYGNTYREAWFRATWPDSNFLFVFLFIFLAFLGPEIIKWFTTYDESQITKSAGCRWSHRHTIDDWEIPRPWAHRAGSEPEKRSSYRLPHDVISEKCVICEFFKKWEVIGLEAVWRIVWRIACSFDIFQAQKQAACPRSRAIRTSR